MKAEKQRLLEEGTAMMLQGAWRCKKAKRKAAAMKEKKQRLMEEAAAGMLQAAWRCKKARGELLGRRAKKSQAELEHAAAKKLGAAIRRHQANRAITTALLSTPRVYKLLVKGARGLRVSDGPGFGAQLLGGSGQGSSDPYVRVVVKRGVAEKRKGYQQFFAQSQIIKQTLNPEW